MGAGPSAAWVTAATCHGIGDPMRFAAFPFTHRLRLDVELTAQRLRITTTITGTATVPVATGFHPYLAPPGARREDWRIELPVERRIVVDDQLLPTGASEPLAPSAGPLGARVYDDGFTRLTGRPATFAVEGGGRRLEVAFEEGYPFAQVYAPPDLDVVCFEPMTTPTAGLARGEHSVATAEIPHVAAFSVKIG